MFYLWNIYRMAINAYVDAFVKMPNQETLAAFKESENLDNLQTYRSSQELFDDLNV